VCMSVSVSVSVCMFVCMCGSPMPNAVKQLQNDSRADV